MRPYVCVLGMLALAAAGAQKTAKPSAVAACKSDAGWNDPAKPQDVFGNRIADGEALMLGPLTLTAHATPRPYAGQHELDLGFVRRHALPAPGLRRQRQRDLGR